MSNKHQYKSRKQRLLAKREACKLHIAEINELSAMGYDVQELTKTQYRIDGFIDIYPLGWRYIVPHVSQKTNGDVPEGKLKDFIDTMAGIYNRKQL